MLRIVAVVLSVLVPTACGPLSGPGGSGCRGDGTIVLDPGYYHLTVGDSADGTVTDVSPNGSGSISERDNCRGVARIGFRIERGVGQVGVTALATGACTMTFDDGPSCVDSSVIIAPADSSSARFRRGASPAV